MRKIFMILAIGLGLAASALASPAPDSLVTVSVRIHYPVNVSESITDFSDNARAVEVLTTLEKDNFNVTSIIIKGWASPESSVAYNQNLSLRRAQDVKKIIAGKYSFPDELYNVQGLGENWEQVIDYIRSSKESSVASARTELLGVIDKYSNLDAREAALKSVAGGLPYRTILTNAYPSSRYADCDVVFSYTSISDEDAATLFPAVPPQQPDAKPVQGPVEEAKPMPAPVAMAAVPETVEDEEYEWDKWFVAVQGGPMASMNENTWTYKDIGAEYGYDMWDLITPYVALSLGHYFTPVIGARLAVNYADNKSALNHNETAAQGFYPYSFKSIGAFADLLVNLSRRDVENRHWFWTLFGGLGYAHGFDFEGVQHPWQTTYLKVPSNAFGMRGGLNLEAVTNCGLGFMLEGGIEAFTDGFNGMNPGVRRSDTDYNFPFDVRPLVTLGLSYHF